MLRPEIEYWATPEAYIRQLNGPQRPAWFRVLAGLYGRFGAAMERRRVERAKRPQRVEGTIPGYIRQDIGLPPASDFPWYRDPL